MKLGSPEIEEVYKILAKEFKTHRAPVVDLVETQTRDPFKVLVATILSARTKDETTAAAAKRLFARVRNIKEVEEIGEDELRGKRTKG
jgi:endonuclease III